MNEYINEEAIVKELEEEIAMGDEFDEKDVLINKGLRIALKDIRRQPTTDVQPIVHCKDCKYRKEHHYEENGEKPYIKYECKFTKYSMSDDGFCSFGVKKDGDING